MAPPRVLALPLGALLVASCATTAPETPAEAVARREVRCEEAGFTRGDDEFKLCLLLQQTNDRLTALEQRLTWLEQQVGFASPPFGPRGWWW